MRRGKNEQTTLFRGIYEFDDPSGTLLAARVPHNGTVDLYDGTAVIVKPNQCALFVHKGIMADLLPAGTHRLDTENVPILSQLANWKFGLKNPLRSELWFFSGQLFTGRRWGTTQPLICNFFGHNNIPVRAYGNFNVAIEEPRKVFNTLIGVRTDLAITDIEDFVQGQIMESLPEAMELITRIEDLQKKQDDVSRNLETLLEAKMQRYGLRVQDLQIMSLLPTKEVLQALEERAAMNIVGNQREYLLYKAANSLDQIGHANDGNDSMQMMLGMMLGKGLLSMDYHQKESAAAPAAKLPAATQRSATCPACESDLQANDRFCSQCGERISA